MPKRYGLVFVKSVRLFHCLEFLAGNTTVVVIDFPLADLLVVVEVGGDEGDGELHRLIAHFCFRA